MKSTKFLLALFVLEILFCRSIALAGWGEPVPLDEINVESLREWTPYPSYDGLRLYFAQGRGASSRHLRIYQAERDEPFGPFTSITEVLRAGDDVYGQWVSPDNLRIYYTLEEGSDFVLRMSDRASVSEPWSLGVRVPQINALGKIYSCSLTPDELILFFGGRGISGGHGGQDIWMARRSDPTAPFSDVTNLSELNTSADEGRPSVTADGLTLFFASNRNGVSEIFAATRPSVDEPFGPAEHLSVLDVPGASSSQPGVSGDGATLYFVRGYAAEKTDIWVSHLARLSVAVDIKPGSCPNPLNPASRGVLAAAVPGSEDFDVTGIDAASVRLEGVAAVRSHYEDVAAPVLDGNECQCNSLGPDGYTDLLLHFRSQEVVEQIVDSVGDVARGDVIALRLTGTGADGRLIEGEDCVVLVGNVPRWLAAGRSDVNKDGVVNMFDVGRVTMYWLERTATDY